MKSGKRTACFMILFSVIAVMGVIESAHVREKRFVGLSFKDVGNKIRDTADTAAESTKDAAGAIADVSKDAACAIADVGENTAGAIADVGEDAAGAIADVGENTAGAIADVNKDAAGAIADGGNDAAGAIADVAETVGEMVVREVPKFVLQAVEEEYRDLRDIYESLEEGDFDGAVEQLLAKIVGEIEGEVAEFVCSKTCKIAGAALLNVGTVATSVACPLLCKAAVMVFEEYVLEELEPLFGASVGGEESVVSPSLHPSNSSSPIQQDNSNNADALRKAKARLGLILPNSGVSPQKKSWVVMTCSLIMLVVFYCF